MGGRGWLLYDAAFRQQIRSYDLVDFSHINQSLYSTTFLASDEVLPGLYDGGPHEGGVCSPP